MAGAAAPIAPASMIRLVSKFPVLLTVIGTALFLMGVGYLALLSTAFSQEPDSPAIVQTALHLELTRSQTMPVQNNLQRLLIRNNTDLTRYLEQQGWTQVDQLGSATFYRQNNQALISYCSMYSSRYMIGDLKSSEITS